jgi:hypothetical protein
MAIGPPFRCVRSILGVAAAQRDWCACERVVCVEICMNLPWRKEKSMKAQRKTKAVAFSSPACVPRSRPCPCDSPATRRAPAERVWWRCEMETHRNAPALDLAGAFAHSGPVVSPPWRAPANCLFRALPFSSVPGRSSRSPSSAPALVPARRHPTWNRGPIQTPRPRRRWFAAPRTRSLSAASSLPSGGAGRVQRPRTKRAREARPASPRDGARAWDRRNNIAGAMPPAARG